MASSSSLRSSASSLPHLLSSLPRNGQSALVRPVGWPETSFYKVTRTKLKFRSPPISSSAPASGSSSSTAPQDAAEGAEKEGLKAYGKAWGMLYRNGSYQKPSSPIAKPDEEIRKGLKLRWIKVEPSSLPSRAQEELNKAAELLRAGQEGRDSLIKDRRKAKRARVAQATNTEA